MKQPEANCTASLAAQPVRSNSPKLDLTLSNLLDVIRSRKQDTPPRVEESQYGGVPEGRSLPGRTPRDDVSPPPSIRPQQVLSRPGHVPSARVMSRPLPPLAELLDLAALRPKRGRGAGGEGPGELARLLDELARHVLSVRPYRHRNDVPQQVVMHLSAEMLAAALKRNEATIWRWTQILQACDYLEARSHYTTATLAGERTTMVDGTLYAVRLQPGHRARLDYQDLNRQYRDLDADRAKGHTAHRTIATIDRLNQEEQERLEAAERNRNLNHLDAPPDGKNKMQASTESYLVSKRYIHILKQWAVTPGLVDIPLNTDTCIIESGGLKNMQDVVYLLPTVLEAHPSKRSILVDLLSTTLARVLDDEHSRAYYAKTIWSAYHASVEGRNSLQMLAAQLARLDVDRREWVQLRRPAALLASRLRPTG